MPTHIVKAGECLSLIAARYGFNDYKTIYNHPDNAAFKKARPDPNIIHPGDQIAIPDLAEKSVDIATGQTYKFQMKVPRKKLKLRFHDSDGKPYANDEYVLEAGDQTIHGSTNGDGELEEEIPIKTETARITLPERVYVVRVGGLNPIEETSDNGVSGMQARLKNLGIDHGDGEGVAGRGTGHAIAMFQAMNGLPVTGAADDATIAKLKTTHGS